MSRDLRLQLGAARREVKRLEGEVWLAETKPCAHCDARGEIYAHDPSGDGHGGLNGGSWGYFQCHVCHGEKRVPKGLSV